MLKRRTKPKRKYLTPAQKAVVIARQKGICACGCDEILGPDPRDIEFDHILDLQWGGGNDLDNFRALVKKHHLAKTVRQRKERAKADRIAAQGGRRKMTVAERELARMLERNDA